MTDTWYDNENTCDIVYSPDDKGWYALRWLDDRVSPIYKTRKELTDHLLKDEIKWENSGREY